MGFTEEHLMAEQGLSAYERGETAEPLPPVARRILRAREALGLTQDEVAARWGEQVSMYWDLELYDDEAFTVISVRQLQRLAAVLRTSVNALLFGEEPVPTLPGVSYDDVVARLRVRMVEDAVSADQLGDRIGWDIRQLLNDPSTFCEWPIDGLRSVCLAADVNWVEVVSTI
jgi:transcriptional regulator with XRE-family HTH domain